MLHAGQLRSSTVRSGDAAKLVDWPARFRELAGSARDPRLRRYYSAAVAAAETPLSAAPLIAMDIETTGLDPQRDGIVSIGLVPMSLQRIRASQSRHWLLKPRVALGAESVTIHGITDATIENSPDLLDVLSELLDAMAGMIVVVHCRDIERPFFDQALRARIGEGISFPVIDTMDLEAQVRRPARLGLLARLRGQRAEPVSIRLADCRQRYGLPRYRPHHAMTDALASAELLQAQISHHFSADVPVGHLWK